MKTASPTATASIEDRLLKASEVAPILGVSKSRAYVYMKSGLIPSLKLGPGRGAPIRTSYRALMEWIQQTSATALPDFLRK